MNKKLIIIALILAITMAKFSFKDKFLENAKDEKINKIKEIINKISSNENLTEDILKIANKHQLNLEDLKKALENQNSHDNNQSTQIQDEEENKEKKHHDRRERHRKHRREESSQSSNESEDQDNQQQSELTEDQIELLKSKFFELKQQGLQREQIREQMKAFAELNGMDLKSVRSHFIKNHKNQEKRRNHFGREQIHEIQQSQQQQQHSESEDNQDSIPDLTEQEIALLKAKFQELKSSAKNRKEFKSEMRSFAESNGINIASIKKHFKKHCNQRQKINNLLQQNQDNQEENIHERREKNHENHEERQKNHENHEERQKRHENHEEREKRHKNHEEREKRHHDRNNENNEQKRDFENQQQKRSKQSLSNDIEQGNSEDFSIFI